MVTFVVASAAIDSFNRSMLVRGNACGVMTRGRQAADTSRLFSALHGIPLLVIEPDQADGAVEQRSRSSGRCRSCGYAAASQPLELDLGAVELVSDRFRASNPSARRCWSPSPRTSREIVDPRVRARRAKGSIVVDLVNALVQAPTGLRDLEFPFHRTLRGIADQARSHLICRSFSQKYRSSSRNYHLII